MRVEALGPRGSSAQTERAHLVRSLKLRSSECDKRQQQNRTPFHLTFYLFWRGEDQHQDASGLIQCFFYCLNRIEAVRESARSHPGAGGKTGENFKKQPKTEESCRIIIFVLFLINVQETVDVLAPARACLTSTGGLLEITVIFGHSQRETSSGHSPPSTVPDTEQSLLLGFRNI